MFKFLGKMISKIVGWGIRKLGGGLREIGEKLATYDIDITDEMVRPNIIQSMSEVDMIGKYDDISKYDPVPYEKIIESKDKLTRNYLTKVQVFWSYERDPVPHAEILSVTHDENISLYDIERRVSDILDDYSTQQQLGNVKIVSIERVATLHREGNAY
jgi:hypothetical protein